MFIIHWKRKEIRSGRGYDNLPFVPLAHSSLAVLNVSCSILQNFVGSSSSFVAHCLPQAIRYLCSDCCSPQKKKRKRGWKSLHKNILEIPDDFYILSAGKILARAKQIAFFKALGAHTRSTCKRMVYQWSLATVKYF